MLTRSQDAAIDAVWPDVKQESNVYACTHGSERVEWSLAYEIRLFETVTWSPRAGDHVGARSETWAFSDTEEQFSLDTLTMQRYASGNEEDHCRNKGKPKPVNRRVEVGASSDLGQSLKVARKQGQLFQSASWSQPAATAMKVQLAKRMLLSLKL